MLASKVKRRIRFAQEFSIFNITVQKRQGYLEFLSLESRRGSFQACNSPLCNVESVIS